MSDSQLATDAPPLPPLFDPAPAAASPADDRPLVEPLETFVPRLERAARAGAPARPLPLSRAPLPAKVSHRQFQTTLDVSQGRRGACWAFAGVAALEAAYARVNIHVDLSEQYLFHLSKAHENHRLGGGVNSLIGFQGGSDIVHHLKHWAVPVAGQVPFINQPELQALANAIPGTGGGLANAAGGTREQADWFEYDLRHIPLVGRWNARYRVQDYLRVLNFKTDDIRNALAAGHDVVVDVNDLVNNGGHVLLIFGYDDKTQTFEVKNSQAVAGSFTTMKYTNDPRFTIRYSQMHCITAVAPVETQLAAMWIGRWETDHDGWRGRLVIRRFVDILGDDGLPGPNKPISLGTWYDELGRPVDVVGHFVDGGRGLMCTIGSDRFELYLHLRDPYHAGGRCFVRGSTYGVVLSRGTALGAGSWFDRKHILGLWDTMHDGWRGQMRIGAAPSYVQSADAVDRRCWNDPMRLGSLVDAHVDFGPGNPDQHFELHVHTREGGVLGGITQAGGRDWPVEGRMSQNLYTIPQDGKLHWYQHTGRAHGKFEWAPEQTVGSGWNGFRFVFGGGDGVIYGIKPDGALMWYCHEGRNDGTFRWKDGQQIGTGWNRFRFVFAGEGGVIYGVQSDGVLLWYRHLGRREGTPSWQGPFQVGTGWNSCMAVTAGPDGCVYGLMRDGALFWYRHDGHDQGYPIWRGRTPVATGWQIYERIWAVGNGHLYARTAGNNGELWLWRHHGFLTGENSWTPGAQVGAGWGGTMVEVFTT